MRTDDLPRAWTVFVGEYALTVRGFGVSVRHRRHGHEVTALDDGRIALVTWPSLDAACADIERTFDAPPS